MSPATTFQPPQSAVSILVAAAIRLKREADRVSEAAVRFNYDRPWLRPGA